MLREDVKKGSDCDDMDQVEIDWWNDRKFLSAQTQPGIMAKIQKWHSNYRKAQNSNLIRMQEVKRLEERIKHLEDMLSEIRKLSEVLIGKHGKEHYEAEQRLMHLLNPVIGVSANGLAVWNEKFELIDPGSYELDREFNAWPRLDYRSKYLQSPPEGDFFLPGSVNRTSNIKNGMIVFVSPKHFVTPEYDERNPIWISEMVLILGAERFIDSRKRYPGRKIRVLEKDLNRIVEVYPETVKIPYLGNLMPNCRCVPAGCQVNVGAGGYVGVRKLFHAKE